MRDTFFDKDCNVLGSKLRFSVYPFRKLPYVFSGKEACVRFRV